MTVMYDDYDEERPGRRLMAAMRLFRGHPLNPLRLLLLVVVPLALLRVAAPGAFTDPYLDSSSMRLLLGDASHLLAKARSDGHWLAYLWGGVVPDIRLDWLVRLFYGLWALTGALVGIAIFREDDTPVRALLVALAVTVAPPMAGISADLAVLVPVVGLFAAYALVALVLPLYVAHWIALFAVPAAMMLDGHAPLVLLAILLSAARKQGDVEQLVQTGPVFVIGAALGALLTLVINAAVFGSLGTGAAAADGGLVERLGVLEFWAVEVAMGLFGEAAMLSAIALGLALAALYTANPYRADRLFGGAGIVLAVIAVRTLMTGIKPDLGDALALWILCISTLAWAGREVRMKAVALPCLVALAGFLAMGAAAWQQTAESRAVFQQSSRAMAAEIVSSEPDGRQIVIGGSPGALPGAWSLSDFQGLARRIALLTGHQAVQCPSESLSCTAHRLELVAMPARPHTGWIRPVDAADGAPAALLIRLPDGVFRPAD